MKEKKENQVQQNQIKKKGLRKELIQEKTVKSMIEEDVWQKEDVRQNNNARMCVVV